MMPDELDDANDIEMKARESAINRISGSGPEYKSTGQCLHCDEPVEGDRRWCNADCRDAFIKEEKHGKKR